MLSIRQPLLVLVICLTLLGGSYVILDYWKGRSRIIHCDDGERRTIDYRDFQLRYSANKISLQVEILNKLKVRSEIDPKVLQTAYESTQHLDQFLKGVVIGYNSCAISKADYVEILQRYQTVEAISKNLSQLLQKTPLTPQDGETAKRLIEQYASATQALLASASRK